MTQPTRDEIKTQVEAELLAVLKLSEFGKWWNTPLPTLGGFTGEQLLTMGQGEKLLAHVKGYSEESFS